VCDYVQNWPKTTQPNDVTRHLLGLFKNALWV